MLQEATKGSQQSGQELADMATVCRVSHLQGQSGPSGWASCWLQVGAMEV